MWCDPRYRQLYCKKNLPDNLLPRCPLLEKVFNDIDNSFDDIFYPPKFTKPPQPKSHGEYKLTTIGQLIKVLDWWVNERVAFESSVFWFYAYSYAPCGRRAIIACGGKTISDLITEFNFSHPAIAAELKEMASNLTNKAIEWDEHARLKLQSQGWIDPSHVNPVEVKGAAAAMLYKLQHIYSLVKADAKQNGGNGNKQPEETEQKTKPVKEPPELNDAEQNIIEALGTKTLIGEELAEKAGYPYNSNFKSTLARLRKRAILGNKAPGYFLEPEYHFLLNKSD